MAIPTPMSKVIPVNLDFKNSSISNWKPFNTGMGFWTNDIGTAFLEFSTELDLTGTVASIVLENQYDKSLVQKTITEITSSPFYYQLGDEIQHEGRWFAQISVKKGEETIVSNSFAFMVNASIGHGKVARLVSIETFETLATQLTELHTIALADHASYEGLLTDGVLATNIENKLLHLETTYKPELNSVKQQLAETKSELAHKAEVTEVRQNTDSRPINVSEMDTETKQLLTNGGSVAVVGEQAVGNENMKHEAVSVFNTQFVDYELIQGTQIQSEVYLYEGVWYVDPAPVPVTAYKFPLKSNSYVSIENFSGANRFRVAVLTDVYQNEQVVPNRIINSDDTKKRVEFFNTNGVEVVIYSANTLNTVSKPIVKQVSKIKSDIPLDLTDSVSIEDTTFLTSEHTEIPIVRRFGTSISAPVDGEVFLQNAGVETMTYRIDLEPYQNVTVKINGGFNTVFRVGVMNDEIVSLPERRLVDRVLTLSKFDKEVSFINDEYGKQMWVYLGWVSEGATATITATTARIVPKIPFAGNVKRKFKLEYTAILEDTGVPTNRDEYPSMCAVKMDNSRPNEQPRPVGWLYRSDATPYTFYYSSGTPDNMKEIFEWDTSLAGSTYNTPEYYSPFVTKYGDIVFVFRGDRLSTLTDNEPINPDARRNPIVYPASDYSNPVVVDVGEVKPTAWLQNCGADYIYNQDTFMFSEYTRPLHGNSYVWKVSEPVTGPDSWQISKTFELSGSMNVGMKHCHTMNYDSYSEMLFMTTGDDSDSAKIFTSSDNGTTWQVQMEGSEKHCRVLNFVFKEDKIYWATDSGKIDFHFFFEVPRDPITKVPDFSAIKELYKFKNKNGQQATYANVAIEEPSGLLFLDRYDNPTIEPMEIYFWSFETNSMHILDYLNPVEGVAAMFGFRVEALNWYQSTGKDKRIVMGYGHPPNDNALLGNKINNRINNLALEVKEVVDF